MAAASRTSRLLAALALALALVATAATAGETRPDVSNTKHNLSVNGPGAVKAQNETQVCVFCHTPHGAESLPGAPLWNRKTNETLGAYTRYDSASINASIPADPDGSSKLCLSCHDGALAINTVGVLNGLAGGVSVPMQGAVTTMPGGANGETSGFTRKLGVDLRNDHPISFTYDSALALTDGELRDPPSAGGGGAANLVYRDGTIHANAKDKLPLETGKVQCTTCHDPHIRDKNDLTNNIKFLRLNRFQEIAPGGGAFNRSGDIICIACHDKLGTDWAYSAHANDAVADEAYRSESATLREFADGVKVWQAACLNCHDTHTVTGARRLLREGTDITGLTDAQRKDFARANSGLGAEGTSAIESTCYQCHTNGAYSVLQNATGVPNIEDDFKLARRMPVGGSEVHDITDADFRETRLKLGYGNLDNRHAECTDCHNPHRVIRNRCFNGRDNVDSLNSKVSTDACTSDGTENGSFPTPDARGTHNHAEGHTNIASGVLRGTSGVEPNYTGVTSFYATPTNYTPLGGVGTSPTGTGYVTKEYQVCLKCHSNYAYDDDLGLTVGNWNSGGRPARGGTGLTPTFAYRPSYDYYTNQAREFNPAHPGETAQSGSGASGRYDGDGKNGGSGGSCGPTDDSCLNHRSWHPVVAPTQRTKSDRAISGTGAWRFPWDSDVGTQSMYCTDCHGSGTGSTSVDPGTSPWGPHGSANNFILKGNYSNTSNELCLKCHTPTSGTGFCCDGKGNLHSYHIERIGSVSSLSQLRCNWCHVAVPHGWKNKSLLANLNDLGPEVGVAAGTSAGSVPYSNGPYYVRAYLRVKKFKKAGNWTAGDCGPVSGTAGKDWMTNTCDSPSTSAN